MLNHTLFQHLTCSFQDFKEKKLFIDCNVCFEDQKYQCHRLVLSHFSSYFKNIFKDTGGIGIYDININKDMNPQGMLISVLDFFYSNQIEINDENVVALLSIAIRYGIPKLKLIAMDYYKTIVSIKNVLQLSKKCVEYDVMEIVDLLIPIISKNFDHFNKDDLFNSLNPIILVKVLKSNYLVQMDDDDKLIIIDKFNDLFPITERKDMELLATVCNWNDDNSYKFLGKHKCLWMPSNIIRPLYRKLMKSRRATSLQFSRRVKESDNEVSSWYPLTWVQSIINGDEYNNKFNVEAVSFLSSMGKKVKDINPILYGIVKCNSSTISNNCLSYRMLKIMKFHIMN